MTKMCISKPEHRTFFTLAGGTPAHHTLIDYDYRLKEDEVALIHYRIHRTHRSNKMIFTIHTDHLIHFGLEREDPIYYCLHMVQKTKSGKIVYDVLHKIPKGFANFLYKTYR